MAPNLLLDQARNVGRGDGFQLVRVFGFHGGTVVKFIFG